MGNNVSEQMLALLKELSVYKAMDEDYDQRERRRQEIKQEMQQLAAESKVDLP
jgi:hypothetical protein